MTEHTPIAVAYGDGIGPEIMDAVLTILRFSRARICIEAIEVGQEVYKRGNSSGIPSTAWDTIFRNKIILKSPITTPQGEGVKSLNVTLRSTLGLYANIRPCIAYAPFVPTHHPDLNLVIVRENEEDLYTGIEYRQTHNMYQALKLISRSNSERISRYAFDYALCNNRKKVSCFSKDNIMKMTDGTFHKIFNAVAANYPTIEHNHYIIDIGSARIASSPEQFDVIVTSNLYGDIISDIAAEISGSVGLAGSANIGDEYAMFEAIHGSAPDIAGQNIANPSGLLHGAIMMLVHIGQPDIATKIHNAWLTTIEEGIHTADIYNEQISREKVGTAEFSQAVIKRLGQTPRILAAVEYKEKAPSVAHDNTTVTITSPSPKQLVGVDVFLDWNEGSAALLADTINDLTSGELRLQMINFRGLKVWPGFCPPHATGDHWRLRFVPNTQAKTTTHAEILYLLTTLTTEGFDVIQTQNLYVFGDELGFSLGQGE